MSDFLIKEFLNNFFAVWWKRLLIFLFIYATLVFCFIVLTFNIPNLAIAQSSYYFNFIQLIAILIVSAFIESARINSHWHLFGLMLTKEFTKDWLLGFTIAVGSQAIILLIALAQGSHFELLRRIDIFGLVLISFTIIIGAILEELLFRGILFQSLIDWIGEIKAIIFMSVLFGSFHLFNPSITFIAYLNIIIAGVLLSFMYIKTKSLWLPISYHIFWNLNQPFMLGSNISGLDFGIHFSRTDINNLNPIMFGGNFGIEGGLLTTAFLIISFLIVNKFSNESAFLSSLIFKRNYSESKLLFSHNSNRIKNIKVNNNDLLN